MDVPHSRHGDGWLRMRSRNASLLGGIEMYTPRLRIAQIAPLAERVPPLKYGGTERVVAALTNELVRRGHDVTLFATGDSDTLANLVPLTPSGLRLLPGVE